MSTLSKRRRTYNSPGDAHELTISCFKRMPLLRTSRSKAWFADSVGAALKRFDFQCWAFVIMPEHVHLIVFPNNPEYDVDSFRRALKARVTKTALEYLRQHKPNGLQRVQVRPGTYRFWQDGPGFDRNLFSPKAIRQAIEYLHANPVRRGLAEAAIEYEWSSARQYAGLSPGPLRVDVCPVVRLG